jgi:hypothetical protein
VSSNPTENFRETLAHTKGRRKKDQPPANNRSGAKKHRSEIYLQRDKKNTGQCPCRCTTGLASNLRKKSMHQRPTTKQIHVEFCEQKTTTSRDRHPTEKGPDLVHMAMTTAHRTRSAQGERILEATIIVQICSTGERDHHQVTI